MKRLFAILVLMAALCSGTAAQHSQREKMIHMAAVRIADQIGVQGGDRETFISLYQGFKKESAAIMREQYISGSQDPAEAKILGDFDKSEKILALRKAYYVKVRTVLSPSQIQKMYDLEKAASARSSN